MSEHLHKEDLEELLKQFLPEIQELRKEVSQISKALAYRSKKVTRKDKFDRIDEQITMSIVMNGKQNKRAS